MNKKRTNLLVGFIIAFVFVIGAVSVFSLGKLIKNGSPSLSDSSSVDTADLEIKSGNTDIEAKSGNNDESKTHTNNEGSRRTANYSGPTICQVDQYIYNSDGKILKDFHDGERYYLDMTVNADASEAVLVYDNVCYYIDAELNVTEIASDVSKAGICFDGGYCYCIKGEVGTPNQELFIYDIWNQTTEPLAKGNIIGACISPNGRVVAFYDHTGTDRICTAGIDIEKKTYITENSPSVVAVSNDATMIYFNEYSSSKDCFKCIDHEQEIKLSEKFLLESYFTKSCDQIMYMDNDGVKYYKAGDSEPTILTEDTEDLKFDIAGGKKMPISFFSDHYIVDTDFFSDAMMMHSFDDCYAFSGNTPKIICLTKDDEKAKYFQMAITAEGPVCIGSSDGDLVKFTYDGKEVTRSVLYHTDEISIDFATNKTLDKIWFILDNDVYYLEKDKDAIMVADQGSKINLDLMYDPLSDRCFYVKEDKYLCSVGTNSYDNETVCDYCHMLTYVTGEDHLVGFYDHDSHRYIVIGDEIVEEE
jgi:hypothetical protein